MRGVECACFGWLEREVVCVASVLTHGKAMSDVAVVGLMVDNANCGVDARGNKEEGDTDEVCAVSIISPTPAKVLKHDQVC